MIEVTIEELQKKFESLPEDLRWAIMAANVDDNVIEMGKEFGLNVEQMGQLSLETHAVMFGYTHPDKFEESIKASLGLPDEKIKAIVNSVNEKILKNIREQLMALHGVKPEPKKEEEIFGKAGIEIMPEEITAPRKDENIERPADMLSKVENPELITKEIENEKILHSISAQKLSGPFTIPAVKTDYSLPSLSKNNTATTPLAPKIDPYREIPE